MVCPCWVIGEGAGGGVRHGGAFFVQPGELHRVSATTATALPSLLLPSPIYQPVMCRQVHLLVPWLYRALGADDQSESRPCVDICILL
jgi:hypothetical protein